MSESDPPEVQDPKGMTGAYWCPSCRRETWQTVLAIVNSREYFADGLAFNLHHHLTINCNGCGAVSFCHISKCSEDEDFTEQGMPFLPEQRAHYPQSAPSGVQTAQAFIDPNRLAEIAALPTRTFDTVRLLQLLRELDSAYAAEAYLSCAMLVRSVLDHVPPMLGQRTFAEVANNYAGSGKSFRDAMLHLEGSSRKIADGFLHLPIRAKEALPTRAQVEFRADIDALLSEIVRVTRGAT